MLDILLIGGAILQYCWAFATVSHLMMISGAAASSAGKHSKDGKDKANENPKKKRKIEPRLGSPVALTSSRQEGGTYVTNIHMAQSRCKIIRPWWVKKPRKNEEGYLAPVIRDFSLFPIKTGEKLVSLCICMRRNHTDPKSDRGLPSKAGSPFPWRCFVGLNTKDWTLTCQGDFVASVLTDEANKNPEFLGNNNLFVFSTDKTHDPPEPVNYYLRDKDTVLVLSKVYTGFTKYELENDSDIMTEFFASLENGQRILANYTEEDYGALAD